MLHLLQVRLEPVLRARNQAEVTGPVVILCTVGLAGDGRERHVTVNNRQVLGIACVYILWCLTVIYTVGYKN